MPEDTVPEVPVRELTDEEVLKRAEEINNAREQARQEELKRAEAVKKAEAERKAEELKRAEEIRKAEEAQKAAKIAEAEQLKREEEKKKEEELRNARRLVSEDDAKKAAEAKAATVDEPKKKHTGLKVFGVIILLLIIFAGVCVASCSFSSNPTYGTPTLSYTSNYNVWLQQGTTTVAGQQVTVLGAADQMMITLPGMPAQRISQGEIVRTNPATMSVTLLWGAWKVMDITYVASFKYMGVTADGLVTFHTSIATDKQIPEFLLNVVLSMAGIQYQKA